MQLEFNNRNELLVKRVKTSTNESENTQTEDNRLTIRYNKGQVIKELATSFKIEKKQRTAGEIASIIRENLRIEYKHKGVYIEQKYSSLRTEINRMLFAFKNEKVRQNKHKTKDE